MNPILWQKATWRFLFLCGCLVLSACAPVVLPPSAEVPSPVVTPAAAETGSATPAGSPSQQIPAVILVAPAAADPNLKYQLESTLKDLSTQAGLSYGEMESVPVDQVPADTRLIVTLAPDPGLAGWASTLPKVNFLGIGINAGESIPANVDVVNGMSVAPEISAFIAGYIAALITDEWRVGVLSDLNTPAGQAAADGFINGAEFFCGLCNPSHPPFTDFPTAGSLTEGASLAEGSAAVDALVKAGVTTLYIPAELSTPDLLAYAAGQGLKLIGTEPPPDAARSQWVATLIPDLDGTLRALWPDLISGKCGQQVTLHPGLTDVDSSLVTPGKQRLVNEIIQSLANGTISARSVQTP